MMKLIDRLLKRNQEHRYLAHAGYYTSNCREAVIVVLDSSNQNESLSIWSASRDNVKQVFSMPYPNGIDLWYSAMMARCGTPTVKEFEELAAKGNPKKLMPDIVRELITLHPLTFKRNFANGCSDWRYQAIAPKEIAAGAIAAHNIVIDGIMQKALGLFPSRNIVLVGINNKEIASRYFDYVWIPTENNTGLIQVGKTLLNNV